MSCDRYDPSSGLCRRMHSTHLSPVLCTAGWTTVTSCSRVFQPVIFNVCSQCSTLLSDSFPFIKSLSCHTLAKGSSLVAHQTACADKLCTLVHRCLYGEAPSYLAELVVPTSIASNRAGLRSAQSLSVAVPRTHSTFGDRAFSVAAPRAWNNLPPHIRHGRLLKEREIFSVFTSILTVVFLSVFLFYVFILLFGALVMFLSHLLRLNLDLHCSWLLRFLNHIVVSRARKTVNVNTFVLLKLLRCV